MAKTTITKKNPRNYDYTKIDNQPDCKAEPVICPVCLENENKVRLGHKTQHIIVPLEENLTHLLVKNVISHNHFALYKGTHTPATSDARNVHCEVDRLWVSKKDDCYVSYRLKGHKRKR